MRKYSKFLVLGVVAVCALGAGRAYYSSIEGMLAPGVIRAYPAVMEELYSDGTVTVRMSVWAGVETPVRVRITGIAPTDISRFTSILNDKLSRGTVFVQTVEQFDQSQILFGTIFYRTQHGYRDVAVDLLDAQCATPTTEQSVRIIPQEDSRNTYQREEPRREQPRRSSSCGSGKLDGKRIALEILSGVLNK